MKSWVVVMVASSLTGFYVWEGEHYLEFMLKVNPGNAPFIILLEWSLIILPLMAGSVLVLEEAFYLRSLPKADKVVDVETFVSQLNSGKLKLSHQGMEEIAGAMNGRLRVTGEKVLVSVRKQRKPRVQVERSV